MECELNTFIAAMASEVPVESSGTFTLDASHAAHKLQAYRLPDPSLFVLNLVASACCSGASFFRVETQRNQFQVFFNGILPEPEGLERLFDYILKSEAPPALRELALAVHGAQGMPSQPQIRLRVTTREGAWAATVRGMNVEIEPLLSQEIGVEMLLQSTSAGFFGSLFKSQNHSDIAQHLFHFCRHAPLDLRVNGKARNSGVSLGLYQGEGPFARRQLQGQQPLRSARPGLRRLDVLVSANRPSSVASSMLIGLATPEVAEREGLLLVSRGVSFYRPQELLKNPLACAVVTADHLEKNLSQTDLVENEDYQALIRAVREQVEDLFLEVCSKPPCWSEAQKQAFLVQLVAAYPSERRPEAVELFFRLQSLQQLCARPEAAAKQLEYFQSLPLQTRQSSLESWVQVIDEQLQRAFQSQDWSRLHRYLELAVKVKPVCQGYALGVAFLAGEVEVESVLAYWLKGMERSPTMIFFELEKALWSEDFPAAENAAERLKDSTATPFLWLWLGFYFQHREEYAKAADSWHHLLQSVSEDLYELWYPKLWGKLSGKVPLATQIRWQARRGLRLLRNELRGRGQLLELRCPPNENPELLAWAEKVWRIRRQGGWGETRRMLLDRLIQEALTVEKLRLVQVTSPLLSTALPTLA